MRSYYVYARSLDNQFFSCSIFTAQAEPTSEHLIELAYREFQRIGNPLPPAHMIRRLKLIQDCRNFEDAAGYETGEGEADSEGGGYVCYSEYSHGDPTH